MKSYRKFNLCSFSMFYFLFLKHYTFILMIRDLLGNNRIVMGDARSQDQVTHYYPFGLSFAEAINPDEQPYKFSNKEFITDNDPN